MSGRQREQTDITVGTYFGNHRIRDRLTSSEVDVRRIRPVYPSRKHRGETWCLWLRDRDIEHDRSRIGRDTSSPSDPKLQRRASTTNTDTFKLMVSGHLTSSSIEQPLRRRQRLKRPSSTDRVFGPG